MGEGGGSRDGVRGGEVGVGVGVSRETGPTGCQQSICISNEHHFQNEVHFRVMLASFWSESISSCLK